MGSVRFSGKRAKLTGLLATLIVALFLQGCSLWSGTINSMMPKDSRPGKIEYAVETVTDIEYDKIGRVLTSAYPQYELSHIERMRKAGITAYEGPQTCLTCHSDIEVTDAETGVMHSVDLLDNLTTSAHYNFFTKAHPNVWGFNGELADDFPMGKIDRPCPKPGSFAMTAWAEIVVTAHGDTMSEGCGQCHIAGQYQAPLGEIMPMYGTLEKERETIDCLICHSVAYDMNRKQVVVDDNGLRRWDQDRSMKAAMAVTTPTSQTCLRCHQHNFGGDIYVDEADPSFMESLINTGYDRPRVLHPGSKRGTPYSPSWDVHAAAGLACIDCHTTQGHHIAKGLSTTTMMSNDLPNTVVACANCHTAEPHENNEELADYLNMHTERVACVTCHITELHPDNATMRDFANPVFHEHEGIWVYDDIEKETLPGKGIVYTWWNGDATFLGNAIGDNPNNAGLFRFYDPQYVWPEYEDYDYAGWYEEVMRPISRKKPSRLYAMKRFNGRQHIDLQNMGPFGGMFVPYNLPTYYLTGDPDRAASGEMEKSMMKKMYGFMFDVYLMNKFMSFMDVDGWDTGSYEDVKSMKQVEPRWMPMDAHMEISHAIRLEGALTCTNCHSDNGVLDWKQLGYTADEVASLRENPLE